MDYLRYASQIATRNETQQRAVRVLNCLRMILERAVQGLEDASGESADRYAWRTFEGMTQKVPDA